MRWATTCTIEGFDADKCFSYSARHWSGAQTRRTYKLGPHEAGTLIRESFESVETPAIVLQPAPRRGDGIKDTFALGTTKLT
jgi:hypothetical protein